MHSCEKNKPKIALCYFKIPGLASSLLQALKMRPSIMKKLQAEMTK